MTSCFTAPPGSLGSSSPSTSLGTRRAVDAEDGGEDRARRFLQRRLEENPTSKILGEGLVAAEGGELMQFRVLAET